MFWSPESIRPDDCRCRAAAADIDELLGDVGGLDRFDRPPMEMQARLRKLRLRLAEAQFDRNLVGLHGVDRLEQPTARPARAAISANTAGLAPPPPGSARCSRSWPRRMMSSRSGGEPCGPLGPVVPAPRVPAIAAAAPWAAATAALVVPGHECPFAWNSLGAGASRRKIQLSSIGMPRRAFNAIRCRQRPIWIGRDPLIASQCTSRRRS